jgi:hypothetical protein
MMVSEESVRRHVAVAIGVEIILLHVMYQLKHPTDQVL